MGGYWCKCARCGGGKAVVRSTWYLHNTQRVRQSRKNTLPSGSSGTSTFHRNPSVDLESCGPPTDVDERESLMILNDLDNRYQGSLSDLDEDMDEDVQEDRSLLQVSGSPSSPSSSSPSPSPPPRRNSSPPPPSDSDSDEQSPPIVSIGEAFPLAHIPKIRTAIKFIEGVESATLASQFSPEELLELLEPHEHLSTPLDDPSLKLSLLNYLALLGSSRDTYEAVRQNIQQCVADTELLSYFQIEKRARELSGLVTWEHHMCVNSCVGFTGPHTDLTHCPTCGEARYDQRELAKSGGHRKVPRKVFTTFPIGPQIQARWKNPQTAQDMYYRWAKTEVLLGKRAATGHLDLLDDILCGNDYLNLAADGKIKKYDTVLMLSLDGAQLYESKQSNVWIYIWILVELAPDKRYKIRNILPGGVIPGPRTPDDLDSFLFPGLSHLSALQKEGLPIWDSYSRELAISFLFLLLVLADAVAMAEVSGSVGHHGRKGCRLLCGFIGRNKKKGPHYYPAILRPFGFENHRTSSHPDVDINSLPAPDPDNYRQDLHFVVSSPTQRGYERRRFHTGIGKPSVFTQVPRILPLPTCFAGDLMHQPLINLTALLLDLWCARPDAREHDSKSRWPWAVLTGDVWVRHGKAVANAAAFLPTSFGKTPRNPQEKISSGYKAWEFLYYIYGLGPGLLFKVLPDKYYSHFCQLVQAIRIIYQKAISRDQVNLAHKHLLQWVLDFELLYCCRRPERLHFIRQCVHSLTHLARETHRLGPLCLSSQWTMERVIGYFGFLLRQPSNPFRHLAAQARRVAISNTLFAMWPDLEITKGNPRGSIELGDDYLLLGPKDTSPHNLSVFKQEALDDFFGDMDIDQRSVYRWGRLKLPTEQVARSRWKEVDRCSDMARMDRNVKFEYLGNAYFGEVKYYFTKTIEGEMRAYALVSPYSLANTYLLKATHDTLVVCRSLEEDVLLVIDVKVIQSVVAMIPFSYAIDGQNNYYFMVEKIGLDVLEVATQDEME